MPPSFGPPPFSYATQSGMYQGIPLYLSVPYPALQIQSSSSPHHTETSMPNQHDRPSYYFGYFYPQRPIYFPLSVLPHPAAATAKPQPGPKPTEGPHTCPSYPHMCGVYPYHHYPFHPHYYPVQTQYPSQYSETQTSETTIKPFTTTSTTATPTMTTATDGPSMQSPNVQCRQGTMKALLPLADPYSFYIRGLYFY